MSDSMSESLKAATLHLFLCYALGVLLWIPTYALIPEVFQLLIRLVSLPVVFVTPLAVCPLVPKDVIFVFECSVGYNLVLLFLAIRFVPFSSSPLILQASFIVLITTIFLVLEYAYYGLLTFYALNLTLYAKFHHRISSFRCAIRTFVACILLSFKVLFEGVHKCVSGDENLSAGEVVGMSMQTDSPPLYSQCPMADVDHGDKFEKILPMDFVV